jgi:hypothetical protein
VSVGVIIGLPITTPLEVVHKVQADLAENFPGVRVAVVGRATGMVSFTYTTTDDESQRGGNPRDRWAAEAKESLAAWHKLEEVVPEWFKDQRLGMSWPQVIREYIIHLQVWHDATDDESQDGE